MEKGVLVMGYTWIRDEEAIELSAMRAAGLSIAEIARRTGRSLSALYKKLGPDEGKARGEKHYMAKLSEEDVRKIRASKADTWVLAQRYRVSDHTIRDVRNRRNWKHVL